MLKMLKPFLIIVWLGFIMLLFSCKKDKIDITDLPGEIPDLTTTINSSVSGFVTNENNTAVTGATVKMGTATTTTDKYGYFQLQNISVTKYSAFVTISKSGYFKAVKTYAAIAGKSAFFRVKLIPKTISGTITAAIGGNVSLPNGLRIALPANAVVTASNGTEYTGVVSVSATWIDPTSPDLALIMPGDLRGINESGIMRKLITYGMAGVELTSSAGELLQIAPGKKATLTFPIPSALSQAPASIPLWYFDESLGLWKEEGSATKTGDTYIGEVSHFSFWNCDVPNAIVPVAFTIVDAGGNSVGNAHVVITPINPASYGSISGMTDSSGFVSVFVTPNTDFRLDVYNGYYGCGNNPSYSQNFSAGITALNLGNVILPAATSVTISGTATNCSSQPLTNGYLVVRNQNIYTRYPISSTGAFNFTTLRCNGSNTLSVIAEDISGLQQSAVTTFTLAPGNNNIGNIQACGTSIAQFITYTFDGGAATTFALPMDSVAQFSNGVDPFISFIAQSSTSNNGAIVTFGNQGISAGTVQNLSDFVTPPVQYTIPSTIPVNIVEYGAIGGFIAGNFTGMVEDAGISKLLACSFRVKRQY